MKTYIITTGSVFGLLALVHVWRAVEEGSHLATDTWYVGITILTAALSVWAFRVLRLAQPPAHPPHD
jgi:hypothetical protein